MSIQTGGYSNIGTNPTIIRLSARELIDGSKANDVSNEYGGERGEAETKSAARLSRSDVYVRSGGQKAAKKQNVAIADIERAMAESSKNESLSRMVEKLAHKQGGAAKLADGGLSAEISRNVLRGRYSEEDVEKAKADIAEDGYYGVKQTSERILDFAKALAGDDPSKIAILRDAVAKGFAEAEKSWGGKLPDICGSTYDAVMKGFDEWEGSYHAKAANE